MSIPSTPSIVLCVASCTLLAVSAQAADEHECKGHAGCNHPHHQHAKPPASRVVPKLPQLSPEAKEARELRMRKGALLRSIRKAETRLVKTSPELKQKAAGVDAEIAAQQKVAQSAAAERNRLLAAADLELGAAMGKRNKATRGGSDRGNRVQLARERVELRRTIDDREERVLAAKPDLKKRCDALQARIDAAHTATFELKRKKQDLLMGADADLALKRKQLTEIETRLAALARPAPETATKGAK